MGHAGIKNRGTLIALRLLLGAAEAGFVPSVFISLNALLWGVDIEDSADQSAQFYLSTWNPKYHLAFRLGLFAGMYSIASAFSGLIAVSDSRSLMRNKLLVMIKYGVFHIQPSKFKD